MPSDPAIVRDLRALVVRAAPATAHPAGPAAWMLAAAQAAVSRAHLADISAAAWLDAPSPAALANRFRKAGLLRPIDYAAAFRAAAMGVFFSRGFSTAEVAARFDSDPAFIYRIINRLETERGGTSARATIAMMRQEPPPWTSRRYLVPLLRGIPPAAWGTPFYRQRNR